MKRLFLIMLTSVVLSLIAASEDMLCIENKHYPEKDPYLFVSTIHNSLSASSADHLACVSRDFNHGVLIGLFRFCVTPEWNVQVQDWSVRAEALLDAINTDRLYEALRDRLTSSKESNSLQQVLCGSLSGCAINCERVLFQEEYQQVNGQPEAFALQLDQHRAHGCAFFGRLIVGMKCLSEQCVVNCHLCTTKQSFFVCNKADIWCQQKGVLLQGEPFRPRLLTEGFSLQENWRKRVRNMLLDDVRITTQAFTQMAASLQWMQDEVSNPTVIGIHMKKLRRAIAQK